MLLDDCDCLSVCLLHAAALEGPWLETHVACKLPVTSLVLISLLHDIHAHKPASYSGFGALIREGVCASEALSVQATDSCRL